jgi:restriction system protein
MRDTLLAVLFKIKPDAFERLAQRILREAGFTKVEVTGKSRDGGIDGIGILRVNLVSFTVLFQCKRYKAGVGASDLRDFRGAMMERCDKGLFITTGLSVPMLASIFRHTQNQSTHLTNFPASLDGGCMISDGQ